MREVDSFSVALQNYNLRRALCSLWRSNVTWDVSILFYGEAFMPSKSCYVFSESHDVGEIGVIGRYKDKPKPYGTATIQCSERNIIGLCELAMKLKSELFSFGATDIELCIIREYINQCNEELSKDELMAIAKLECPLTYSAYQADSEEHA